MKKFALPILALIILAACGQKDTTAQKIPSAEKTLDKETIFSFDINNLQSGCDNNSEIVCIINTAVKCTINPEFADCSAARKNLPDFIFMQDESLQRPTFQSYKITKMVPREDGSVEIHTQSSCNGSWFGLCSGNIIYVMKNIDSIWKITDMYAVEL